MKYGKRSAMNWMDQAVSWVIVPWQDALGFAFFFLETLVKLNASHKQFQRFYLSMT